jgi:hypothetical protein
MQQQQQQQQQHKTVRHCKIYGTYHHHTHQRNWKATMRRTRLYSASIIKNNAFLEVNSYSFFVYHPAHRMYVSAMLLQTLFCFMYGRAAVLGINRAARTHLAAVEKEVAERTQPDRQRERERGICKNQQFRGPVDERARSKEECSSSSIFQLKIECSFFAVLEAPGSFFCNNALKHG